MSSKMSKRNIATKVSNVIVTRKRAALQNRQIRGKSNKIVKPTNKTKKTEVTSSKSTKIDTVCKDTPLKSKVRTLVRFVERVEYYPDKLKRDISNKKIMLKPKPNYKVIGTSNKRKLAVPQKGLNISSKKCRTYSSSSDQQSELSMVDMVKLIENNHNLSDEDLMEILTCPSPVWWEDPPDDKYIEDALCSRAPEPSHPAYSITKNNRAEELNKSKINKSKTQTDEIENNKTNTQIKNKRRTNVEHYNVEYIENINKELTTATTVKNIPKFNEKKQKLESILGNIKNVKNNDSSKIIKKDILKNSVRSSKTSTPVKNRRISNSTDGDMSDMSFNEEEILKHLEYMDIPLEQSAEINDSNDNVNIYIKDSKKINNEINIQKDKNITIDNALLVPKILPPLKRKPIINNKVRNNNKISDSCSQYNLDYVSHSDFKFITDDDISFVKTNVGANSNENLKDLGAINEINTNTNVYSCDKEDYELKLKQNKLYIGNNTDKQNELCSKKPIKDLTEYITIYKIISNDTPKKSGAERISEKKNKLGNVKDKMNKFFKKCKSNKRLKKSDMSLDSLLLTNNKELSIEEQNSDEQTSVGCVENRLKPCGYCIVKTENGMKNFSCADCEKSPSLSCNMCMLSSEKPISSCKDVARISWKHNYIINET